MKLIKRIILAFISLIILSSAFMLGSYADMVPPWSVCSIDSFESWIYLGSDESGDFKYFSEEKRDSYKSNYLPVGFVLGFDPNSFRSASVEYYVDTGATSTHAYNEFLFYLNYSNLKDSERNKNSYIDIRIRKIDTPTNIVGSFQSGDILPYDGNVSGLKSPKGVYERSYGNLKVYYIITQDYHKEIRFLTDGYYFLITPHWGYESDIFDDIYEEFMTSEKTASLAALFSDDQAVFENAMANIILNIQNAENYVYAQPRETVALTETEAAAPSDTEEFVSDTKDSQTPNERFNIIWVIAPISVIIVASGVVAVVCVKKKRKK